MNEMKFADREHYNIYIEVDRIYHRCETSVGRCICISDYIRRLLNEERAKHEQSDDEERA